MYKASRLRQSSRQPGNRSFLRRFLRSTSLINASNTYYGLLSFLIQAMDSAYTGYSELRKSESGKSQIRLLKLWRSPKEIPELQATLETTDLHSGTELNRAGYHALSWCWGAPGRYKPMLLDGHPVRLRDTLHSFLSALARRYEELIVWVDALCINQSDEEEKSSQVRLMGDIYRNADDVYVWLGPGDAGTDLVFERSGDPDTGKDCEHQLSQYISQGYDYIFSHNYWSRLWTLQERTLAKDVWLLCGDCMSRWETLRERWRSFRSSVQLPDYLWFKQGGPHFGQKMFKMSAVTRARLIDVIATFDTLACLDIRDRAYGLRELAGDGASLPVDYKKLPIDVFFEVLSLSLPGIDTLTVPHSGAVAKQKLIENATVLARGFPIRESDILQRESVSCHKSPTMRTINPLEDQGLCVWLWCGLRIHDWTLPKCISSKGRAWRILLPDMPRVFSRAVDSFSVSQGQFQPHLVKSVHAEWSSLPMNTSGEIGHRDRRLETDLATGRLNHKSRQVHTRVSGTTRLAGCESELWRGGHIQTCSLTPSPLSIASDGGFKYVIRVHYSRAALIFYAAAAAALHGHAQRIPRSLCDMVDKLAKTPTPPCQCSESLQLQTANVVWPHSAQSDDVEYGGIASLWEEQ